MIADFTIASQVNTLQEYYDRVYKLQSDAHKPEYMLVHDEIKKRIEDCNSYTELGINQGTTLAIPVLKGISTITAYDITLGPYNRAKGLFDEHAKQLDINYNVYEANTLAINIDPVDVLYIDTVHLYDHLIKELALHGGKANKFIIVHDTFVNNKELKIAVEEYVDANKEWSVVTDCEINVGFMTIEKKT